MPALQYKGLWFDPSLLLSLDETVNLGPVSKIYLLVGPWLVLTHTKDGKGSKCLQNLKVLCMQEYYRKTPKNLDTRKITVIIPKFDWYGFSVE